MEEKLDEMDKEGAWLTHDYYYKESVVVVVIDVFCNAWLETVAEMEENLSGSSV